MLIQNANCDDNGLLDDDNNDDGGLDDADDGDGGLDDGNNYDGGLDDGNDGDDIGHLQQTTAWPGQSRTHWLSGEE